MLLALLRAWAPPVKASHEPKLPYWHLQGDGLWEVEGAKEMPRQRGNFPVMGALRASRARLPSEAEQQLRADRLLTAHAAQLLLDKHFPETLHASIASAVGLVLDSETETTALKRRRRDPAFQREVLRAYEHRCVVTGFRAALDGAFFGVEAAHVRAHCYDGPDIVGNGMVLTPTMHLLLDRGAWTLTDDRRVLVSSRFTGSDEATDMLRRLHGRQIRTPLPGSPQITETYIKWHREPAHGGVFRAPSLPL